MSKISRWIVLTITLALVTGVVVLICNACGAFATTAPNGAAALACTIISVIIAVGEIVGTISIWKSKTIPDITVDKPKK